MKARLSICYAAPGHRLVPTAGPTRNMLCLADALSELADVTLAFRHTPASVVAGIPVLAIEPGGRNDRDAADDVAQRGLNPIEHLAYVRRMAAFARDCGQTFDVVLEKGWRLSGTLASAFTRLGVPAVLVENDVRPWWEPIRDARMLVKYGTHLVADAVARRHSNRVPIIAETDELKAMLVRRGAAADRVEVIGLGVDHRLFHPRDQAEARRLLGIDGTAPVFVYVGAMDKYHDLAPVIDGLSTAARWIELHVVGDGSGRGECERLARDLGVAVRFHGRIPHTSVPTYIAAGDACIAAYREHTFFGDAVPFSTLKVPEYMAAGRAVVGNATGQARALLEHGISAFLFPNDAESWARFFADMPTREQLAEMGRAAAKAAESLTWVRTAERYLEVCRRATAASERAR
jgi:glycosyltransferase involved in cell wall biosynthesis